MFQQRPQNSASNQACPIWCKKANIYFLKREQITFMNDVNGKIVIGRKHIGIFHIKGNSEIFFYGNMEFFDIFVLFLACPCSFMIDAYIAYALPKLLKRCLIHVSLSIIVMPIKRYFA